MRICAHVHIDLDVFSRLIVKPYRLCERRPFHMTPDQSQYRPARHETLPLVTTATLNPNRSSNLCLPPFVLACLQTGLTRGSPFPIHLLYFPLLRLSSFSDSSSTLNLDSEVVIMGRASGERERKLEGGGSGGGDASGGGSGGGGSGGGGVHPAIYIS